MTKVRVKICGIREVVSAQVCAEARADMLGLVFVPGRRRTLSVESAHGLVTTLRDSMGASPKVVGLFADQPLDQVQKILRDCGLDMAQLCGDESMDYCGQVDVPVIKVLHVPDSLGIEDAVPFLSEQMEALRDRGHFVTLDRKVESMYGGTGESFRWEIARELSMQGLSFFLAGGLNPENVAQAVRTVRPWGVDVSSGVETDGVKDEAKIKSFISNAGAARSVDQTKVE